jgi:5-formyltetrahydrofolate cyclo-ligase
LAAGRDGNRLGRGKGFYDRAVSSLDAPRVVVVHDTEVFNHVPAEGFDQKVSMVISCSEMIDLDGRLN